MKRRSFFKFLSFVPLAPAAFLGLLQLSKRPLYQRGEGGKVVPPHVAKHFEYDWKEVSASCVIDVSDLPRTQDERSAQITELLKRRSNECCPFERAGQSLPYKYFDGSNITYYEDWDDAG